MAEFKVLVRRIIEPVVNHPNADKLTIIALDGFLCIANKHENGDWRYKVGDHVVYIPEGAVLPEWLLRSGSHGNRVKAIRLRSVVSQGILYKVANNDGVLTINANGFEHVVTEGQDVADLLNIIKYEPQIPAHMAGEVCNIHGNTVKYDVENIQNYPDTFDNGENVVVTEKLHGSCCQTGIIIGLKHPELFCGGDVYVGSKGLSGQGLVFKDNERNAENMYVRAFKNHVMPNLDFAYMNTNGIKTLHIIGEVFGKGVQDLTYGLNSPSFRVFDILVNGKYLSFDDFKAMATMLKLEMVPVLYEGPFDRNKIESFRDGKDSIRGTNIREGIVIKSRIEKIALLSGGGRFNMRVFRAIIHEAFAGNWSKVARIWRKAGCPAEYGRKSMKWVSPDYLLRKNKNATEFS